jgi:hypothetical protein
MFTPVGLAEASQDFYLETAEFSTVTIIAVEERWGIDN